MKPFTLPIRLELLDEASCAHQLTSQSHQRISYMYSLALDHLVCHILKFWNWNFEVDFLDPNFVFRNSYQTSTNRNTCFVLNSLSDPVNCRYLCYGKGRKNILGCTYAIDTSGLLLYHKQKSIHSKLCSSHVFTNTETTNSSHVFFLFLCKLKDFD